MLVHAGVTTHIVDLDAVSLLSSDRAVRWLVRRVNLEFGRLLLSSNYKGQDEHGEPAEELHD